MIDHNEFFYRAAGELISAMDIKSYMYHYHDPFDVNYRKYRADYQGDIAYIRAKMLNDMLHIYEDNESGRKVFMITAAVLICSNVLLIFCISNVLPQIYIQSRRGAEPTDSYIRNL